MGSFESDREQGRISRGVSLKKSFQMIRRLAVGEGHNADIHFVHRFNSDHDAVRAMQDLCSKPNKGRNIPGLGKVAWIWYAYYSKHYTDPRDNPTGLPRGLFEAKGFRRRSSSTLSRDSNPYRNQQPNNIHFNTPSFTNFGPSQQPPPFWAGEASGPIYPHMVPLYQPPTQRTIWEPDSADQNRKLSNTEPKPKNGLDYQPKTYPKRPDGVTALKEDWRSKPPAEEVIEDISSDEAAAADSSSNVSSQGAGSIKVCLPNETGSSRSRSVSPHAKDAPSQNQVLKDSSKSRGVAVQGGGQAERGAIQDSKAEDVAKDDGPTSSGYRKATTELAVPVEELQPTVIIEQAQITEEQSKKGLTSYSKVTSELTEATENFDINTVIRHKPPRSPLPKEWMDSSELEPPSLQDRFGALNGALQLEALEQQVEAYVPEGMSVPVAPGSPKAEEAPTQKSKPKKNWHKGGKSKGTKSKASNGTSISTSSSTTPTDAQSRGASRASNNRPASQTSNSRPESAAGMATQSPTRSQPVAKKKNVKSQRKRKQQSTAEQSAAPEGQIKTAESQDHARTVSVKESPTKKPKIQHFKTAVGTREQSAPEIIESVDGTQSKAVVDKHDDSTESSSQIDAGGSMRVQKEQLPQNLPQKSDRSDEQDSLEKQAPPDLPVVFEVPAGKDHNNCSPEANLFPNQKFTIDKVKRDSAMATETTKESDVRNRQPSAMRFTTKDARIALPLLPPNSKPSVWPSVAARGPRSKSDDPFTTVGGESQPEAWLRDKAVRTPQKPRSEPTSHQTSPTPSPKKKADVQGGNSRLNAAAKSFEPSSTPASPVASVVSVLSATALPFHKNSPSLPGQKGPVEQRLVTPAEQVVDPTTVTQPDPPTKEKKRVGPAPDRGGGGGQKERAKSDNTALAAPANTKKTAARAVSAVSIASRLGDEEEFPSLAAAAAVPQRRVSWAVKASAPVTGASSKTVTAVAPQTAVTPKPPVTSPNNVKLGQRGEAPAAAAEKQGLSVGVGEKAKASENQWTTVGSGKKPGVKKNGNGNNGRSTSGKSGSGATGQGGRAGGQGARGGKVPVGEERKGG